MTQKYRLFRRKSGIFFIENRFTKKQESLKTKNKAEAGRLFHAKNEAHQQPEMNLHIAKVYLMASDLAFAKRTWQTVMEEMGKTKTGPTHERWIRAVKQKAFDPMRNLQLIDTKAEILFSVLEKGTVATNIFLRRMHNFALDMNWLPCPIIPKRHWPAVRYGQKRAITWEEHLKIIGSEKNSERKALYELCWQFGGSQGDIANLHAQDIDWGDRTLSYRRRKTDVPVIIHFGEEVESTLRALPKTGPLFPYLIKVRSGDRATEFKQRCVGLGIHGVSLHSYRYAWAERARKAGYPERFAQEALGHNSKAVHRAYAKKAQVKLPSLEEYESRFIELVPRLSAKAITSSGS